MAMMMFQVRHLMVPHMLHLRLAVVPFVVPVLRPAAAATFPEVHHEGWELQPQVASEKHRGFVYQSGNCSSCGLTWF